MHSAELNVPQNHVYLFKPQTSYDWMSRGGFAAMTVIYGKILA